MKGKIEVGDKVRIAESVDPEFYNKKGPGYAEKMGNYLGKEGTVHSVEEDSVVVMFEDGYGWSWLYRDVSIIEEE